MLALLPLCVVLRNYTLVTLGPQTDTGYARQPCVAILREALCTTLTWAIERVEVYAWNKDQVVAHLGPT
jgi:hypothetical protein